MSFDFPFQLREACEGLLAHVEKLLEDHLVAHCVEFSELNNQFPEYQKIGLAFLAEAVVLFEFGFGFVLYRNKRWPLFIVAQYLVLRVRGMGNHPRLWFISWLL